MGIVRLRGAPTPQGGAAPTTNWPKIFSKSVVFSLTASNPMGVDVPAAQNRAANARLQSDIEALKVKPRAWWHSFGFNVQEGWREDGFSIAFAPDERVYARMAVLRLAIKHRQAAVYYYRVEDGQLFREVIWLNPTKQEEHGGTREVMAVLAEPPRSELAAKHWAKDEYE